VTKRDDTGSNDVTQTITSPFYLEALHNSESGRALLEQANAHDQEVTDSKLLDYSSEYFADSRHQRRYTKSIVNEFKNMFSI